MNVIHNISLFLQTNPTKSSQLEELGKKNKSKILVFCNDKVLEDKYAIFVKKIEFLNMESGINSIEPAQNDNPNKVKLGNKYFCTPLKIKDAKGGETWVKVSREDLQKKYFIQDQELEKVTSGEELEDLIKTHIEQLLLIEAKKSETGIIQSVIKFFLGFFVISPTIKNCIFERNNANLPDLYIKQAQNILTDVKEALLQNNPLALDFFGDEMISKIIDEILIEEAAWNDHQIQKFNNLRKIDFFRKNPDMLIETKQLEKIDFSKMPVSELSSIPSTDTNRNILNQIWKRELNNLFKKGKLDTLSSVQNRRGILIQTYYANKYLELYHSMQEDIKNDLFVFFQNLKHPEQLTKITNFALQHSFIAQNPNVNIKLQRFQLDQEIYSKKIKPIIQKMIKEYSKSADSSDLLKVYTQIEKKQTIDFLLLEIDKELDSSQKQFFDEERLNNLIAQEIETALVIDYHLTSNQLSKIRTFKEIYLEKINTHKLFLQKIKGLPQGLSLVDLFSLADIMGYSNENLEKKLSSNSVPFVEVGLDTNPLKDLERELTIEKILKISPLLNGMLNNKTTTQEEKNQINELTLKLSDEYNIKFNEKKKLDELKYGYIESCEKLKYGGAYLDWLLFNRKTEEDLSRGQHSCGLSPEQEIGLMKVHLLLNKSKFNILNPDELSQITEIESEEIATFLEKVKNDPKLVKVLEGFRYKEQSQLIQDILEITPLGLHGIMQRILPEDPLPMKVNKIPAGLSQDTIEFVLTYVERLKKMAKIEVSLEAVQHRSNVLLKKFDENLTISNEERLTLKELGILSSVERLNKKRFDGLELKFLVELEALGLLKENAKLQVFAEKVKNSSEILKQIETRIRPGVNSHYQGGDIFAYNIAKKEKWANKPLFWGENLVAFVSGNLTHGGKLYLEEDGAIKTSHIFDDFINEEFPLYELCVSDVWGIDVAPLVPEPLHVKMRTVFGVQWQDKINEMYKEIENNLQIKAVKSGKFKKMRHHGEKKFLAGAANYASILNTLFGTDIKGHKRDYNKDFKKLYKKFVGDKELEENQICSEFVSKITLACMIELNKQLKRQLARTYQEKVNNFCILDDMEREGKEIAPDIHEYANGKRHFGKDSEITRIAENKWKDILKERGYTLAEIELTIRIWNKEILDLPYSKTERLRAIHPGRMVSLLTDKKCAIKRDLPPVIQALINIA